jgi:HAD superfamily hydrolase (TIGR01509 family)
MIQAVIFDLDGVLIDSEEIWDEVRRSVANRYGGHWLPGATAAIQGMSTPEWATYLHDVVGVELSTEEIVDRVVAQLLDRYSQHLPLLPGASDAVRRLHERWSLGLASSSPRGVITAVLNMTGLKNDFQAVVSSDEVANGKPQPDVYLEAARRLRVSSRAGAAVEDSANGIRAGKAAGMTVVAIPNRHYPPPPEVLALADHVLASIEDLRPDLLEVGLAAVGPETRPQGDEASREERLDEEEMESFPASDPHSDWAGPPQPS